MKYSNFLYLYILYFTFYISICVGKNTKKLVLDNLDDIKDFKKLLRTKTNVLVCFYNSQKDAQQVIKTFKEVAENIKGEGTLAVVDCSGDAKKMCKKLKIPNDSYKIKHYKDGDFNKDYDRKLTVISMTNFMRDPTGDIPWEEDSSATNIVHIPDTTTLNKFLKRESKPVLVMFYAPWCGFCKSLKPEYVEAADELKEEAVLAAIDVNRPENTVLRTYYNITGFPTLLYFENGFMKFAYEGENKKAAIVSFMRKPTAPQLKIKEPEWSDVDSEVVHLTASSFDPVIKEEASVLVMFYAPWCGHCKKMKPEYESAAAQMKSEGVPGMLAAIDATKEQTIASRFSVKGYPTLIYFSYGEQKFDVNVREAPKIIDFMREPKEPPPPPPPEKPWSDEDTDVVHLTEETFKSFLKKKKHVLVIFYAPWCGHCKRAKPEITEAAAHFRNDPKVEFAAVDCTVHPALCSANNIRGYPTFKYFSYYTKITQLYTGARTAEDFIRFMSELHQGTQTSLHSSDSWTSESAVITLNDENFQSNLDQHEVLLIMFYAPWCSHCQKMKPDFMSAAKELKDEGCKSCLAMVDCTVNPNVAEKYEIAGFPSIKLFKHGKYIKDYTGKRTVEDIKNFIRPYFKKDEL